MKGDADRDVVLLAALSARGLEQTQAHRSRHGLSSASTGGAQELGALPERTLHSGPFALVATCLLACMPHGSVCSANMASGATLRLRSSSVPERGHMPSLGPTLPNSRQHRPDLWDFESNSAESATVEFGRIRAN